ncbi:MAG TPA: nuclear transport factor 2 family protein [Thermoleophilaceae bacterium]|nr:nuclear transport factor 2 family protein [Thermoleophilaceae bacterium]
MSQDNVRVVEAAYEALSQGGLDGFTEYWADDIEWTTMRASWSGKPAGRAYLQELVDLFDDFRTEPIEVIDAPGDRVVLSLRYGGRSKLSGIAVPPEYFAIVLQIRDGMITRGVEYGTREEALEAVGLRQ